MEDTLCISMLTTIRKWGNSLGLRIPKSFAMEIGMEEGSTVDLALEDGELILRPVRRRAYRLGSLLVNIHRKNLHDEIATGEAEGREGW